MLLDHPTYSKDQELSKTKQKKQNKQLLPTQSKISIVQSSEGELEQQSCESDSRTMSSKSMQDKPVTLAKLTHINQWLFFYS